MFPKVFSIVFIIILAKFSSQTLMESKCNDKLKPAIYTEEEEKVTAVFQMESTDAFEPILSLELVDHKPYNRSASSYNSLSFKLGYDYYYDFIYGKVPNHDAQCKSGFYYGTKTYHNCSVTIEKNKSKWLIKVGMNPLIDSGDMKTLSIDMITQPKAAQIGFYNAHRFKKVADDLTELPIYQWAYVRYCEYNKKIYDFDGDMITLKKQKDSFELFIYRYITSKPEKLRRVTLINSKNNSVIINCANDKDDIAVWSQTEQLKELVWDEYIFKKHIDKLRCGVSLSIEMNSMLYASFSFNDTPLKLIYDDDIVIPGILFDSDPIIEDKPEIETITSTTTSTTSIDHEVIDETAENDKVNPLIGVCLTILTLIKSYYDLW